LNFLQILYANQTPGLYKNAQNQVAVVEDKSGDTASRSESKDASRVKPILYLAPQFIATLSTLS